MLFSNLHSKMYIDKMLLKYFILKKFSNFLLCDNFQLNLTVSKKNIV